MCALKRHIIYYVDDDKDDLELFEAVIDELGQEVTLFELGTELLKALHKTPPKDSIIFLDLNMPIKSGYEVVQEIRTMPHLEGIPVVVLSTASDNGSVKKSKECGADFYICKPISPKEMYDAIKFALEIDWDNPPKEFSFCYHNMLYI